MRNASSKQQNKQKINNSNELQTNKFDEKIEKEENTKNSSNFKLAPLDPDLLQKLVNNVLNGAKKTLKVEEIEINDQSKLEEVR